MYKSSSSSCTAAKRLNIPLNFFLFFSFFLVLHPANHNTLVVLFAVGDIILHSLPPPALNGKALNRSANGVPRVVCVRQPELSVCLLPHYEQSTKQTVMNLVISK